MLATLHYAYTIYVPMYAFCILGFRGAYLFAVFVFFFHVTIIFIRFRASIVRNVSVCVEIQFYAFFSFPQSAGMY